jgi:hypothetical protein
VNLFNVKDNAEEKIFRVTWIYDDDLAWIFDKKNLFSNLLKTKIARNSRTFSNAFEANCLNAAKEFDSHLMSKCNSNLTNVVSFFP